ncbi:16S rRNA (guanine(527)-N(7))-methyltransferase RsmG [Legionella sp. CNM-4043-24]|uniref:16S rRNA (guanine(527)-N(7))-methyltransferase RsmG n=1 Tax=Legionella sp. CNM-4043-24 TaxID=3421646 RepID=UPI00403AFBF2
MSEQSTAMMSLRDGLQAIALDTPCEPLMQYLYLLEKWNKAYNLTAIRDVQHMVTRHLLDSLAIHPWLSGTRIIDVGTGAGLPGIPLALSHPHLQFVLLDSNGKKTRFLQEVKRVLNIHNIEIVQTRVENYRPQQGFDTVISRAFSDLGQMLSWTGHLLASQGRWLAMKGRYPETELNALNRPWQVHTYTVPGLEGERCCVTIDNSGLS